MLSGGMDSCVCLAWTRESFAEVHSLFVDYGQRSAENERLSAERQSLHYEVEFHTANALFLKDWSDSRLFEGDLPRGCSLEGEEATQSAQAVWVPGRNGVLVSMAASLAEGIGAGTVVTGLNGEEGRTFRDNTPEFLSAADAFCQMSTENEVRVVAPLINLDKNGIIRFGMELDAPLGDIWSCYGAGEQMCGECESCMRLRRALKESGHTPLIGIEFKGKQ